MSSSTPEDAGQSAAGPNAKTGPSDPISELLKSSRTTLRRSGSRRGSSGRALAWRNICSRRATGLFR